MGMIFHFKKRHFVVLFFICLLAIAATAAVIFAFHLSPMPVPHFFHLIRVSEALHGSFINH